MTTGEVIIRPDLVEEGTTGMPVIWCDTGQETHVFHSDDLKVYELSWDEDEDIEIGGKPMSWSEVQNMGGYTIKVEITQPSEGTKERQAVAVSADWEWVEE